MPAANLLAGGEQGTLLLTPTESLESLQKNAALFLD